jgi:hypothetical protein
MNTLFTLRGPGLLVAVLLAAFAAFPASAADRGYVGGGGHVGAFRGGGLRGAYGWRGGYGGWRGYGFYPGWGYGWGWGGLGYGLFFAGLPLYYSTLWWDGVPYYYAAGDYYRWNTTVGEYETVAPPAGLQSQVGAPQGGSTDLFVYPKNGQSAEQQARDKFECHSWAKDQTGFDPTQPGGAAAADPTKPGTVAHVPPMPEWAAKRQDYLRAQTACLEGRGYSVR